LRLRAARDTSFDVAVLVVTLGALDSCCVIFTREDTTGDSFQTEFIYYCVMADW
jgi:hypothetical protein